MNAKLIFKTVFLIIVALLLVLMGMNNKGYISLSLPPLLPHALSQPAAIMYVGFFGVGFLTGTITADTVFDPSDFRNLVPRFSPEARAANQGFLDLLETIASEHGATKAQIALAWVLAQRPWIVPIPGTSKLHRMQENAAAARITLSTYDLERIALALSQLKIEGRRLPETAERMTGL